MSAQFPIFGAQGSGAVFDANDDRFRYLLWRDFGTSTSPRTALFIMLNPSTADEVRNDPTIRRCIGFAKAWGFDRLEVCNIFALRSTDPSALYAADDPVGPENDAHIDRAGQRAARVIAAWGTHGEFRNRGREVASMLAARGVEVLCLGTSKAGHPLHPLYIPADREPSPFTLPV